MPPLADRLAILVKAPRTSVAAIATEALRQAEPEEGGGIARVLAETGRPEALAEIIRQLPRLGPDAVDALDSARQALPGAVREVLARGRRSSILNAISVASRLDEVRLLPALVDLLEWPDRTVGEAAADAVLAITLRHLGPHGAWRPDPGAMRHLDEALARAALGYRRHRFRPVLLAAALASRRAGPRLAGVLDDPDEGVAMALRGVLDRIEIPMVRRNLIGWLSSEVLGPAASRRIHQIDGAQPFDDLLGSGHLILAPARRRALRRIDRPLRCVPELSTARRLSPRAQAALPRYLCGLGLPSKVLTHKLGELSGVAATCSRVHAFVELMSHPAAPAEMTVLPFCRDANASLAHLATEHLTSSPGRITPGAAIDLESSRHHRVVETARRWLARRDLGDLVARWDALSELDRVGAARWLATHDTPAAIGALRRLVQGPDLRQKLRAIMLSRRLGLAPRLLQAIAVEVKCVDPLVASAAAAAMSEHVAAGSDRQARAGAIRAALDHEDPRVRANAIDALSATNFAVARDLLSTLASQEENRPRANAVRALLRRTGAEGEDLLSSMLTDRRPLHRISAIWVARRARAGGVVPQLQGLAESDRSAVIRARARSALRLITHPAHAPQTSEGPGP